MHCECLRLAHWPHVRSEGREGWTDAGLMDGPGLVPMLLWTEWVSWEGEHIPLVFLPCGNVRRGQGGSSCLSGTQTRGTGSLSPDDGFAAVGLTGFRADEIPFGLWPV